MAATKDPKLELRGSTGNWMLVLTDPDGNDFFASVNSYATKAAAQIAARLLEDSIRFSLPLPVPFDSIPE